VKAVIDTNVFVSGIFWKGPPYRVLQAWEDQRFRLVVSRAILIEYQRVLLDLSTHRPGIRFERALDLVDLLAEVVEPIAFVRPVCTDPDDDKFLAAALSAGADFVVSGDKALLATNGFRGLSVVTPKVFLGKV